MTELLPGGEKYIKMNKKLLWFLDGGNGLLTSLVSYWSFNSDASDSKGVNNGTFQGGASSGVGGILSNGLILSGTSQYVTASDSATLTFGNGTTDLPFSVSLWVNPTNFTQAGYLFSKNALGQEEYYINLFATTGRPQFALFSQLNNAIYLVRQGTTAPTLSAWNHLVFTYSGSRTIGGLNIYLNGSKLSYTDFTAGSYVAMNGGTSGLTIGASTNSPTTTEFIGKMDEIGIWSRELSQADVTRLYNSGAALAYTSFN